MVDANKHLARQTGRWHVSPLILTAILAMLTASASFSYFVIKGHGILCIGSDFDRQQMPFTMALIDQIRNGGLDGWMWSLDLGSGTIPSFSFYELGSPFFWLMTLIPSTLVPRVMPFMYVVKYAVAAIAAHLFIRRFTHDERYATVGALLYAFSGFQTTNLLFYHFHDVVACYPFLLIGIERLMDNKRDWVPLALASFANCVVNYFFFVQSVILAGLYWAFRYASRWRTIGARSMLQNLLRCLAAGLLGVLMAGVLLIPSALYVITTPRAGTTGFALKYLVWASDRLLYTLKGMLLPGENMGTPSAILGDKNYSSTACWLPFVGPSCVLAYVRFERGELSGYTILLVIISFSPLLCSAFLLFSGIYLRWWYGLTLVASLASVIAFERLPSKQIQSCALITFLVTALLCLMVAFVPFAPKGEPAIYDLKRFVLYALVGLAGPASLFVCLSHMPNQQWPRVLSILICVFAAANMMLTLHYYRREWSELNDQCALTPEYYELAQELQTNDSQYRYDLVDNRITLTGGIAGTSSFNSVPHMRCMNAKHAQ